MSLLLVAEAAVFAPASPMVLLAAAVGTATVTPEG
jgi:hypothetical protein